MGNWYLKTWFQCLIFSTQLTKESKSDFISERTSDQSFRWFKLVYILAHNIPIILIEVRCFKDSLQKESYHTHLIQFAAHGLLGQSNKCGATEDNNRNVSLGPPAELFLYLIFLVGVVSVPLTEGNNRNFARGSPTEISFYFLHPVNSRIRVRF